VLGIAGRSLREHCVGGVKFIGSSELWCREVVKLSSYNMRRRGRRAGGVLLCMLLSVHLVAMPWPLHDKTNPGHENLHSSQNAVNTHDKTSVYIDTEIFFFGCAGPFMERA
jgi:hypothetical protein